ncbi:MAG: SDR family NAD(P)-dependent oxidoreductase [Polyangiaceae bacterium]
MDAPELAELTQRMRRVLDALRCPERREAQDFQGFPRCLVTGATSGLGQAVAHQLADMGGALHLPTRGARKPDGIEARGSTAAAHRLEVFPVDFGDLTTLTPVVEQLESEALDLVVLNAGVMTRVARPTTQGLESMFGVNYLATFAFLRHLLGARRLSVGGRTRIVIVSSEAHRSAAPLQLEHLGGWVDFSAFTGMRQYAHSKLLLCTFAAELARRLSPEAATVWALCPGPVNSRIAREAPAFVRPALDLVMRLGFRSPADAARPVVALGTSPEFGGETGRYFHVEECKHMSEQAEDPVLGRELWEATERLLTKLGHPVPPPDPIYLRN